MRSIFKKPSMIFFCAIPILCYLAVILYQKMVIKSFPTLVHKRNNETILIANGAGAIVWDIYFLFCLYLHWYQQISLKILIPILLASLCFNLIGWTDDLFDYNPFKKLKLQIIAAVISFSILSSVFSFNITTCFISLFCIIWMVNAINFIDIKDGLSAIISILLFSAFYVFGSYTQNNLLLNLSLFWILCLSVFLIQNYPHPKVFLGDAGAHLIGINLIICSLITLDKPTASQNPHQFQPLLFLIITFGYLVFDFLYVIIKRLMKKKSIFLKSDDHFVQDLSKKTRSDLIAVTFCGCLQLIMTTLAILYLIHI